MNKKSPSPAERIALPLIILAVVCLCAYVLLPGIRRLHERGRDIRALGKEKAAAAERVRQCQRQIRELDTDKGIERVARDELRLVKPGEIVFFFEKKPRLHREVNPGAPGERRP